MAKRRIILNEDQLPDFGGSTNQFKWVQTALNEVLDTSSSGIDLISVTDGSLTFTPAEMSIGSTYKIYFNLAGASGGSGALNLDIIFGSSIVSSSALSMSVSSFQISGFIFITFVSGADLSRDVKIETDISAINPISGSHFPFYLSFSSDSQFENIVVDTTSNKLFNLRLPDNMGSNKYMKFSSCKKIILVESSSGLINSYKWKQTSTISGILNTPLLIPNSGSLMFTPSEMSEGKKYRVLIKHTTDDPLAGNVNFNIKIGGNSFSGITGLTTGNGESNQFDFILEFKPSSSEVYMYLNGINDGTILNSLLFATINPLINQSIEVIANTALLSQSIIYSTCEIL